MKLYEYLTDYKDYKSDDAERVKTCYNGAGNMEDFLTVQELEDIRSYLTFEAGRLVEVKQKREKQA